MLLYFLPGKSNTLLICCEMASYSLRKHRAFGMIET